MDFEQQAKEELSEIFCASSFSSTNKQYKVLPLTREFALDEIRTKQNFQHTVNEKMVDWHMKFAKKNGGRDWVDYEKR